MLFLVRSNRADLRGLIGAIEERSPGLPHPQLEAAAREHAEFLRSLAARRDVLSRQVLLCLASLAWRATRRRQHLGWRIGSRRPRPSSCRRPAGRKEATEVLTAASDPEAESLPKGVERSIRVVEGRW